MKIILGIDETERYKSSLALLSSLKPTNLELELVNVAPTMATITRAYAPYVVMDYEDTVKNIRAGSEQLLDTAADEACKHNLKSSTKSMDGSPAQVLAEEAERFHADLIVTAAGPHGAIRRLLAGSASYNLACTSQTSLLIARCPERFCSPVSAIFATDHSAYANRALERLLSWNLKGLAKVTVLSAYATEGVEQAYMNRVAAVDADDIEQFVYNKIKQDTDAVANVFREAGIQAECAIVNQSAQEAIHTTMIDSEADLLIMGAKGHSLWERLTLGSTALHQVVAEPYSVMIVRP